MKNATTIPDSAILAGARAALAEAASEPPGLAEAIRRESARRRLARAWRRAAAGAAAAAAVAVVALSGALGFRDGSSAPAGSAEEALRMLLCDASEAIATETESSGDAASTFAVDWDGTSEDFDFAAALVAWQEAPFAADDGDSIAF